MEAKKGVNFWAQFWEVEELISLQDLLEIDFDWGERVAFELGCGMGLDTIWLLDHGFKVTAIDKSPDALGHLRGRPDLLTSKKLTFKQQYFHQTKLSPSNLIHAKFALPFCSSREEFNNLWQDIQASLLPGGAFCGQLLGDQDGWKDTHQLVFHTREQVEILIEGFDVVQFLEVKKHAPTFNSGEKFWHFFHLILKLKN